MRPDTIARFLTLQTAASGSYKSQSEQLNVHVFPLSAALDVNISRVYICLSLTDIEGFMEQNTASISVHVL